LSIAPYRRIAANIAKLAGAVDAMKKRP
jgi:hypothetical protein